MYIIFSRYFLTFSSLFHLGTNKNCISKECGGLKAKKYANIGLRLLHFKKYGEICAPKNNLSIIIY